MSESSVLLEIKDVAKRFGAVLALRGAALTVLPGEIHALMGANGAGKSTLVKIITGVFRYDSGSITLEGVRCAIFAPPRKRDAPESSRSTKIRL